jgi:hypothetical protein
MRRIVVGLALCAIVALAATGTAGAYTKPSVNPNLSSQGQNGVRDALKLETSTNNTAALEAELNKLKPAQQHANYEFNQYSKGTKSNSDDKLDYWAGYQAEVTGAVQQISAQLQHQKQTLGP